MAFMVPIASFFTFRDLSYTEDEFCCDGCYDQAHVGASLDEDVRYCEECFESGWYGRLSASGFMDCTGWQGPHKTSEEALTAVKELFEVDDNGDPLEG